MNVSRVFNRASAVSFEVSELPRIEPRTQVLMTTPNYFDVRYVINAHMAGNVGKVDGALAARQWEALKSTYENIGLTVQTIKGLPGLPDMVFCANQTLPWPSVTDGRGGIVLSRMNTAERQPEVESYADYFIKLGYEIVTLPDPALSFEGMGDALWHEGRRLLWGGYGFRTSRNVYDFLSTKLDVRVLLLELLDPDFYHLDTCLSVLDERTALIFPRAFQPEGLDLIHSVFERVLEAPEFESRRLFACNAHCPNGHHVLIQEGCDQTRWILTSAGFEPVEVSTSEFLKSGGSVFCMKQMFW